MKKRTRNKKLGYFFKKNQIVKPVLCVEPVDSFVRTFPSTRNIDRASIVYVSSYVLPINYYREIPFYSFQSDK